ncbi:hypothetical protein H5410_000861 [Solanum commersonii]|uniref:Uncharacterized protein n=1 Tax=Solanum commersonii TaxID=4109 RepID=A0A9J6AXD7_SOLCO|nr:hypothetical protein H5410_000861 [Solanum commersonii]
MGLNAAKIGEKFLWGAKTFNLILAKTSSAPSYVLPIKIRYTNIEDGSVVKAADKLKWGHQKGVYTVKEGYQQLSSIINKPRDS